MAEYIKEEKRLTAAMEELDGKLVAPNEKLDRARGLLLKAKSAYDQAKGAVDAIVSDRILLEGELSMIREKKSKLRVEARVAEVGGVRPGTADLVEQMDELAGDRETYRVEQESIALDVEAELAKLKASMGDGGD